MLALALILWSLCTALTPTAAELGEYPLIAIRVALGAGEVNFDSNLQIDPSSSQSIDHQGLALPSIYSMMQKYVPSARRSTSVSVITAACYLGSVASNAVSPSVIDSFGWPACFFLFASLPPIFWLPLWTRAFILPLDESAASSQGTEGTVMDGFC